MTLLIFAAFFAVLGIVCILIPFHIGMTGICLLLLAAVLAALWLLKRKNAPKVWGRILIALTTLSMTAMCRSSAHRASCRASPRYILPVACGNHS